ncbi:MAG: hypothetical protein WCF67_00635 [Chitinophagaceae bacterium]
MENNTNWNNLCFKVGLLFLLVFGFCQLPSKKDLGKSMFFSLYDSSQNIIAKNLYKVEGYEGKRRFDSIVITDKKNNSFNFLVYKDTSTASLFCDGKEFLIYSIEDTLIHEISTQDCKINPPFLNKNTSYRGVKNYRIDEKDYKVYHFVADNGVDLKTYDCYFLEKRDPICFYSFDSDEYLICDSLNSLHISNTDLKVLTNKLITDSLFFSKFILEKQLPNFHRPDYK